jgi:hypothetical protein
VLGRSEEVGEIFLSAAGLILERRKPAVRPRPEHELDMGEAVVEDAIPETGPGGEQDVVIACAQRRSECRERQVMREVVRADEEGRQAASISLAPLTSS